MTGPDDSSDLCICVASYICPRAWCLRSRLAIRSHVNFRLSSGPQTPVHLNLSVSSVTLFLELVLNVLSHVVQNSIFSERERLRTPVPTPNDFLMGLLLLTLKSLLRPLGSGVGRVCGSGSGNGETRVNVVSYERVGVTTPGREPLDVRIFFLDVSK